MNNDAVGSYGVLRFMKRQDESVVASFPIDKEEVTIGRDQGCDIRLYYPTVSGIHAKVVFQERKAFIMVLGAHGVLIDNCTVFPAPASAVPTTVPLPNHSELEIHNKRFRFEYPPKELRAALIATPSPVKIKSNRNRTLRLSMIQSAQVFSPAPDPDPRVNLRILQTPIRASPLKPNRQRLQHEADGMEEEEEEPIVLVEGNRPRVVEEEKDLVILEDVEVREELPPVKPLNFQKRLPSTATQTPRSRQFSGSHASRSTAPAPAPPPPVVFQPQPQYQTPRRKVPRSSLHRAVLIRSAQRALMRAEHEMEEEEREVLAVEAAVLDEPTVMEEDEPLEEDAEGGWENEEAGDAQDYEEELHDGDDDGDEEVGNRGRRQTPPVSGWRKSLEAVKNTWQAFRSRSSSPEKTEREEDDGGAEDGENQSDEDMENDENAQTVPVDAEPDEYTGTSNPQEFTPQRPPHAVQALMSPHRPSQGLRPFMTPQPARGSAGLADRVRGVGRFSVGGAARHPIGVPWKVEEVQVGLPLPSGVGRGSPVGRRRVSKEEQEDIQARRRSAFQAPDAYFGDDIPGSRRASLAPRSTPSPAKVPVERSEDEDEDTGVLLERMKEMVDVMKRRRSMREDDRPVDEKQGDQDADEDDLFAEGIEDEEDRGGQDEDHIAVDGPPDEPHVAEYHTATSVPSKPQPGTPQMSELKHMFSINQPTAKPRYTGMQELFEPAASEERRASETPMLEGEYDLFDGEAENFDEAAEVHGDKAQVPGPAKPASTRAKTPRAEAKVRSRSKTPVSRAKKAPAAAPLDVSDMADDEETPGLPPPKASKKTADAPKAAVVRRTRRADSEMDEDSPAVASKPSSRVKKTEVATSSRSSTRTKTVMPKVEEEAPVRRTRKATKATTDDESKPARKPARAAKTPMVSDSEPPKTTRSKASAGSSSKRTRAKASDVEVESTGSDPLDSIDRADPDDVPVAAKVRRGRSQTVTSAPDDADDKGPTLQTSRGRKTPTTSGASGRGTATKSRSAAAPATVPGKENTPEPRTIKEEPPEDAVAKPAAAKVSRTRKATAASAKVQSEPEVAAPKTRAARTRAASARK
ncbi:hypothetical protein FA95DRAFT_1560992 [Auriscalpium vulgare]|uniref:Uncharacterized protein n=1 Tax=Auriscalpium vulgare TaxID=40419 RepID=A0ACB8RN18_9AGAM|nr:hypothetical protein FA95DRAFT_1560992 [Auriscalpium vulgare]